MTDINLVRANVSQFSFNDYLRHLGAVEASAGDLKPLRVAILRSYTVDPIEPVLKLRLLLEGFRPTLWFGGYNQYAQEVLDTGSGMYNFRPDLVVMLLRIDELMPEFVDEFSSRSTTEWNSQIESKAMEIGGLAERIVTATHAQVIIQNATAPTVPYFGVYDSQRPAGQSGLVHAFNQQLATAAAQCPGVFIWDFDAFVRAKGTDSLYDPKMWYVSSNPFKQGAYPTIADDLLRYLRSALGLIKKCVVVDLDNTLWGGIAGEDGLEGIRLGRTYPGNCYRAFQKELLKLSDRGILLAINSKNNEPDALRIIDEHPDMVLRRHHFAAMQINWRDKPSNLREIARELNIGLDSLIFIDDNAAECELVRQACPECTVVQLPDKPYLLPSVPSTLAGIENIRLTAEDRHKREMYQAQASRKQQEARHANLDDFIGSLEVEVCIEPAGPFSIPRIAQLTQKTNQMNMTTRRYTEAQIRELTQDVAAAVLSVAATDRFGDHGIIGVLILTFKGTDCLIDSFLLSCRVIGRNIETVMLAFVADTARARGMRRLVGEFLRTAKNQPAAGVYERAGMQPLSDTTFAADLTDTAFPYPANIRLAAHCKVE